MNLLKAAVLCAIFATTSFVVRASPNSSDTTDRFALVTQQACATLCIDAGDYEVVWKTAALFSGDVQNVSGVKLGVTETIPTQAATIVIAGTIEKNALIQNLAMRGKLDLSLIRGKWEQYIIQKIDEPFPETAPHVKSALVIAGSDRRAVAYGLFSISERIGVSPWYWWADVPVEKQSEIVLRIEKTVSKPPSVKYRGIFINDEDWGLLPWAAKTFEPERKNIGPRTYEKVCELLLRLKANYLCPAMHTASTAFNKIPENKIVADSYGIVMGSVHCEPLLFNNASEWDVKTMGEWDFAKNKNAINRVLRQRIQENASYENVYTLALRGLHDKAMQGSNVMAERVAVMQSALWDQRQILTDFIKKPIQEIPQAFTPYKEVLDVYSNGLQLPDEVTIIWPDDNYGYMKRLSNPSEQKRSGRSGVYYHVSYLGKPHDYLWLATTPPVLMYEELRKAYDTTADRIWLLNVGDIKPCEYITDFFLEMAYDIDSFNYDNVATHHARWLARQFGDKYYNEFIDITKNYYRLAFSRKPEFMGWGSEWNSNQYVRERITDTDFSFINYKEADTRLADYERIGKLAEALMKKVPETHRASFFQLVYYPTRGAELMNRTHLAAQKNRIYAAQGRAAAETARLEAKRHYEELQEITKKYNGLLDGKWNGMMSLNMGFVVNYYNMPPTETVALPAHGGFGIQAEGEGVRDGVRSFNALPAFNPYVERSYYVDIFNKGTAPISWKLKASAPWIVVDQAGGTTATEERIWVSPDWSKMPEGERILGWLDIASGGETQRVFVSAFNSKKIARKDVVGLYIEDNGCISIPAAGFHRKTEDDKIKMLIIKNLGFEDEAVQLGDPISPPLAATNLKGPSLEYDFYTFHRGSVDVYTYALPTFPLYSDFNFAGNEISNAQTKYGICIDDALMLAPTTSSFEYAKDWYENVLRNCAIKKTTLYVNKPGKHTLKVICGDPGVVIQKIVIDMGGMKRSYQGPPSTRVSSDK